MSESSERDLTVHDLLDGLADQRQYEKAHPHLKDYYGLRARLVCQLFGCDLERRQKELDDEKRARFAARPAARANQAVIEARYEINGSATAGLLAACLRLNNQSLSPFRQGVCLEGTPPKIERELCRKHGPQIDVKERELKHLYRQVAVDVLEFLFPGVGAKAFPADRLFEMGLPREEPDPMDYF